MTSAPSLASSGSPSSLSSSPSVSASSQTPSASPLTLSLVERRDDLARHTNLDELANALTDMERLIRDSYAASARVNAAFAAASSAEGLPPLTGHQFISQMSRVTLHISDALGHSADGHRLLRRLGGSLGYDVHAFGDSGCPPEASDKSVVSAALVA